jgi:hypothetical protein
LDPRIDNPFTHDRKKTFQPQDLWEWLLKLAILLFPLDVGIRRIQLDREEWARATQTFRRWLFFWKKSPRAVQADESLAALLNRREDVRVRQTGPMVEVDPNLFQPATPPVTSIPEPAKLESVQPSDPAPPPAPVASQPASTTSQLLEAKRRARKKME